MNFSVLQGSLLGPILFNCCCLTLWDIIPTKIDLNGYADDHTLQKNFKPNTEQEKIKMQAFEKCMYDVESQMNGNRLKLNPNKTEFIIFGSSIPLGKCAIEQTNICGTQVKKCKLICYLGAWLDAMLNFKHHTNVKCHTALGNLKKIRLIRNLLDREGCEILMCSLVLSHPEYSNGILAGAADLVINKLQSEQSFAAGVTLYQNKNYSSIKALFQLHSLTIRAQTDFKILLIIHKYLNDNNFPSYS